MFALGQPATGFSVDPFLLLLSALVVEAAIGEARWLFDRLPHPLALVAAVAGFFERKLNRRHRSERDRAFRGAIVVAVMIAMAGAAGWGLDWLARAVRWGWGVELALLAVLISQRGTWSLGRRIARALALRGADGIAAATRLIAPPLPADVGAIARAALELGATRFAERAVAPVFWYALFGMPGVCVQAAARAIRDRLVDTTAERRAFAFTAVRLHYVLGLIPARLAALYLAAAALFVPTARPGAALRTAAGTRAAAAREVWPLGAMAGALGLALGGPRATGGEGALPWIGAGTAQAGPQDVRRGFYLLGVACLINGGSIALLFWLRVRGLR